MSVQATPADAEQQPALVFPTLSQGAELVGEFKNSGYREPPHLVQLGNHQLVRLPPLLYVVAKTLHDHRHLADAPDAEAALAEAADAVSREAGSRLTAEQLVFLVDRKLAPLGVTTFSNGAEPVLGKADTFLGLKFKLALLPAAGTWFLGGLFSWCFRPLAIAVFMAGFLVSEYWLATTQSLGDALHRVILLPLSILLVIGLSVVSCVFHEIGHATACRYSGVRPGVMGCGIYLVWPAFYTDITESYRLDRKGRIRADLGGVYFNCIFVIALTLIYMQTGFQPLLVAILYVNLEIFQQLMPTLRFDGYYIISDLVGIPDLFKYIGPILRRTLLRRPADDRLKALKRWPQLVVSVWVLLIVPALAFQLSMVLLRVPDLVRADWMMVRSLAAAAAGGASLLQLVASGLQITLLILPLLGLFLIGYQLLRWLLRKAYRYIMGPDLLMEEVPPRKAA
ncbi:hypothetical protein [Actinomadura macrotermitis]|uniref:Peptide zinc metalloprotease protein n=1 Tax=Actinomadura macrotermitis TaxID=2585200 RepID=A0A7K0C0T1_9ACTN|nr:hypothetical protein [Actinomadura macrotermitis]MQY06956.1 hypothetical protein [Actinomadura macrotermitis]